MQAQHTASASAKLPFLFVKMEFLRNRQSGAVPGFRTTGGKIENTFSVGAEHREHGVSRLLLLLFLRMAVGAFQKAGVRMTDDVGYRLFVHATVQERCHKIVPQRVEMILLWEADRLIDFPQTLREGIRVDEPSVLIGEEIGAEFAVCVLRLCFLPLVIAAKDPTQVRGRS